MPGILRVTGNTAPVDSMIDDTRKSMKVDQNNEFKMLNVTNAMPSKKWDKYRFETMRKQVNSVGERDTMEDQEEDDFSKKTEPSTSSNFALRFRNATMSSNSSYRKPSNGSKYSFLESSSKPEWNCYGHYLSTLRFSCKYKSSIRSRQRSSYMCVCLGFDRCRGLYNDS